MKYWAKNGEYSWIGSTEEYSQGSGGTTGKQLIQHGWTDYNFWVQFDGTTDALNRDTVILNKETSKYERKRTIVGWEDAKRKEWGDVI